MRWFLVGSTVLTLTALTACGGGATAVQTVTVAPPTTSSSPADTTTPSTPTTAAPPAATTPAAAPTTVAAAPAAPTTFVMPDEVGKVLQAAQDHIQVVSNDPLYDTSTSDATGAGRTQIVDSGWQVCSQNIAPGSVVNAGVDPIDFAVVRISESCP